MVEQALVIDQSFGDIIQNKFGQNVFSCYQCKKCTNGCPVSEDMDIPPNEIIRSLQFGLKDQVLRSRTIWLCASCETCTTRCPQGIDIARLMDVLREMNLKEGIKPAISDVVLFDELVAKSIEKYGRIYELGTMLKFNLHSGRPFKDAGMGTKMFIKGKFKIFPSKTRYPKDLEKVVLQKETGKKRVAYYSGCSLHSVGREFEISTQAVCKHLGVELIEPENWICCGASSVHRRSHFVATLLPMKNLALVEKSGLDHLSLPCAACFAMFKRANYEINRDPQLKEEIEKEIGYSYAGGVEISSLLDTFLGRVGLDEIAGRVKQPLKGLKVACYYGCLLTRPSDVTKAEHPEYPVSLDRLMETLGAEPLDWSYKTECCGASMAVTQTPIALRLIQDILANAKKAGAEAIVVACPMCQGNLDTRQAAISAKGEKYYMPILYFTQLMGLAMGIDLQDLRLRSHLATPLLLLRRKGILR